MNGLCPPKTSANLGPSRFFETIMLRSNMEFFRKCICLLAVMLPLSTCTGRAAGQSVSLVMEEAALQRACAEIEKAVAAEADRKDATVVAPRCRVPTPTEEGRSLRMMVLWMALAVFAGCIVASMRCSGRRD